MSNKDEMLAILEEAYDDGYKSGCEDTLKNLHVEQITEDKSEEIIHSIENFAVKSFFDELPKDGYGKDDYSKIWPYLFITQVDRDEPSWTECCNPYVIYGKGDKVIVECSDEPKQTILPYKEVFRIFALSPGKTYKWKMYKGTKVTESGEFKTIGRVRLMGTSYTMEPRNFRDLGGFGVKFGRLYRSENPDKVVKGSADHLYLRDQLKISVQVNLREASKPARTDLFEKTYTYSIGAYSDILTASTTGKANFRKAFNAIVTELSAGRNVIFNCSQGCDRTGTMAWFLQSICGVPLGYTEGHWELSGYDRCGNSKIWNWEEAKGGELRTFIIKLIDLYVNETKDKNYDSYKLAYYLATKIIGISQQTIEDFRKVMLAS